jgi:hypothetical protein
MNECVRNASNNSESLFSGTSRYQRLNLIVALTWLPFPAWYALSPEGFNIITNSPAMKVAVAFLNVFSKGVFVLFLMRVRADDRIASLMQETDAKEKSVVPSTSLAAEVEKHHQPTPRLLGMTQETLSSIGRASDYDGIVRILASNMITTPEDVLMLNESYCQSIHLPWTFVFSFKETARRKKVRDSDQWDLAPESKFGLYANASPSAPHIARNAEKLNYALRNPTYATSSRFAEQLPETYQILRDERKMSPANFFPLTQDRLNSSRPHSRAGSDAGSVRGQDDLDLPGSPKADQTSDRARSASGNAGDEEAIARVRAEIERLQTQSRNEQSDFEEKMEGYVQQAITAKVNETFKKAMKQEMRDGP